MMAGRGLLSLGRSAGKPGRQIGAFRRSLALILRPGGGMTSHENNESNARAEVRMPWSRSERRVPRLLVRPLQQFVQTEASSRDGAVLFRGNRMAFAVGVLAIPAVSLPGSGCSC